MASQSNTRLIALVGPLTGERHAVHTSNHPLDPEKMMPVADVLLLVSDDGETAMVSRYTAHGDFGGDTFHMTVAAAKAETKAEYDEALMPWEEVPADIADAHAYAKWYAHERLNDRG